MKQAQDNIEFTMGPERRDKKLGQVLFYENIQRKTSLLIYGEYPSPRRKVKIMWNN